MSSSLKYILYLLALHLVMGVLAYYALAEQKVYLLVVEVALLFSAFIAFRIYRSLIAPLRLLARGAAALEDQDFTVKLMPTGSREMDNIVSIYNRMIDQLRSERVAGRQREEFLDQLLGAADLGVVVLDFDGEIASLNAWMEARCADEAFRTAVLQPSLHLRPRPENTDEQQSTVLTGPGNRRYHAEVSTFVDQGFERAFLIVQDVTSELLSAEKEAYGKVIRMMAHEVNNSNAAVVSVLRTLLNAAHENDEQLAALNREYLPVVINRADNMTAFMRNFARVIRLPAANRQRIDLNELLRRTGEVMTPQFTTENITLRYDLAPGEVWVNADATHLEQVIINALTNARESIGSAGNIVLSSTAFPTGFVVADDGPGIPPEVADQLFTPFFSTKTTGQGVGLTLTRDILDAHGARYALATEEDGWTRLQVELVGQ